MGSGGGGSTTTTTVDPVYNAGLLELSQEQQGWAAEMYNMFKYGVDYDPSEVQRGDWVDGEWRTADELGADETSPEWKQWNQEYQRLKNAAKKTTSTGEGPRFSLGADIGQENLDQWLAKNPEPTRSKLQERTLGDIRGYDPDAQVSEMEYLKNLVEKNQSLLGLQTDVEAGSNYRSNNR